MMVRRTAARRSVARRTHRLMVRRRHRQAMPSSHGPRVWTPAKPGQPRPSRRVTSGHAPRDEASRARFSGHRGARLGRGVRVPRGRGASAATATSPARHMSVMRGICRVGRPTGRPSSTIQATTSPVAAPTLSPQAGRGHERPCQANKESRIRPLSPSRERTGRGSG
jgi:hypothetical protein